MKWETCVKEKTGSSDNRGEGERVLAMSTIFFTKKEMMGMRFLGKRRPGLHIQKITNTLFLRVVRIFFKSRMLCAQ